MPRQQLNIRSSARLAMLARVWGQEYQASAALLGYKWKDQLKETWVYGMDHIQYYYVQAMRHGLRPCVCLYVCTVYVYLIVCIVASALY